MIKKELMIFALLFMATMGLQAQSVAGGSYKFNIDDENPEDYQLLTFNDDGKMTFYIVRNIIDNLLGVFQIAMKIPGNYTEKGDTLYIQLDKKVTDIYYTKAEFSNEALEAVKKDPSQEKIIKDYLFEDLKDRKEHILEEFFDENPVEEIEIPIIRKDGKVYLDLR